MRFAKLMPGNSLKNASRNLRELSVISELGWSTTIYSRDNERELFGYQIINDGLTVLTKDMPKPVRYYKIIRDWLHLARKVGMEHYDVISCHDLIALFIGYLSKKVVRGSAGTALVYDSHEFEMGRTAKRGFIGNFIVKHLEGFLIKHSAMVMMVNDSIAEEVKRIHNLSQKPVVVRNIPSYFKINDDIILHQRTRFLEELNLSDDTFLVMYHGAVMPNRGIENMLHAVSKKEGMAAIILGNCDNLNYRQELLALVEDLELDGRILFHASVKQNILWQFVGAADVGVVILAPVCKNHFYSLPNKLFENIQSLTPIVAANYPEISKIVQTYKIGVLVDPTSINEISNALDKLKNDHVFYQQCKSNMKSAKEDLCWENEKQALKESYIHISNGVSRK